MRSTYLNWKGKLNDILGDVRGMVLETAGACLECYLTRPVFRATLNAFAILLALYGIDSLSGHRIALRMMYLGPIWYAAQRGGRKAGFATVIATTSLLAHVDSHYYLREFDSIWLHSAAVFGILCALMLLIESHESRLQDYVNLATSDPLTRVGNRLALERYAEKAIFRTARTHDPVTFVLVDCDNFKALNDRFGHSYGDHVLKSLARLLKRCVPAGGMVARLGGDEFVVVVPGKRPEEVSRLLRRVSERLIDSAGVLDSRPQFSYGFSVAWHGRETLGEILERADRDMYARKAAKKAHAAVDMRHSAQAV